MERRDELPRVSPWNNAKLQCFLSTDPVRKNVVFLDMDAGSDIASMPAKIESRFRELTEAGQGKLVGRITAPDKMPFKRVIAVVNAFNEARLERVDFAGVEPAPYGMWTIEDLPR